MLLVKVQYQNVKTASAIHYIHHPSYGLARRDMWNMEHVHGISKYLICTAGVPSFPNVFYIPNL